MTGRRHGLMVSVLYLLGMGTRQTGRNSNVHENIEEIVTGKLAHSALPAGNCFETMIHV